ncbi:hypothetical protein EET67_15440 [Pseudaminobacter arsenicus]|uniref:Uncharacterized protein n=1 Tax=Borborobacter arsenicus TaxID=1851146 RepID=A0A432V491_9HYPH|nr:hypothetical protein [Pseudaminobacter arsenicus]RUM96930.1 hypothetical protein EET67_15440 [Pseudaminobacter arsenicus]
MGHDGNEIIPAKFPELNKLAWNRDPRRPLAADEAFALYERNWRFVDREHLTDREASLIRKLGKKYGHGFGLI